MCSIPMLVLRIKKHVTLIYFSIYRFFSKLVTFTDRSHAAYFATEWFISVWGDHGHSLDIAGEISI